MKTFYFNQYVRECYAIEANSEEEALEILYSGDVDPYDTDYSDAPILVDTQE